MNCPFCQASVGSDANIVAAHVAQQHPLQSVIISAVVGAIATTITNRVITALLSRR